MKYKKIINYSFGIKDLKKQESLRQEKNPN